MPPSLLLVLREHLPRAFTALGRLADATGGKVLPLAIFLTVLPPVWARAAAGTALAVRASEIVIRPRRIGRDDPQLRVHCGLRVDLRIQPADVR